MFMADIVDVEKTLAAVVVDEIIGGRVGAALMIVKLVFDVDIKEGDED